MLSKNEIEKWILENCVDGYGDINLASLDFSDFEGNVYINFWKVKKSLYQSCQEVEGNLKQGYQRVEGNLYQSNHIVKGVLWQSNQRVDDDLHQDWQQVKGDLVQGCQKVKGSLIQYCEKCETLKEEKKPYLYEEKLEKLDEELYEISNGMFPQDMKTTKYIDAKIKRIRSEIEFLENPNLRNLSILKLFREEEERLKNE